MDDGRTIPSHAGDGTPGVTLAVRLSGISKRFGGVQALSDVSLEIQAGTIHALIGENGAGKTTLMKVVYGALHPEAGSVEIEGQTVHLKSSREAIDHGVGMVSQHYAIVSELTCLQNLLLGAEGGALIRTAEATQRAAALADKMGFAFDWNAPASGLSASAAQKLEILKLLWRNSKIMILDEPTAMLSPADGEALFESLHRLTQEGATVILVTHRLPEVFEHCSRVTVLRGGRKVAEKNVVDTNPRELAEYVVGAALEEPGERHFTPGEPVLTLENVGIRGKLKSVSFALRQGEVVGIAGVDGSGQQELFSAIAGTLAIETGSLSMAGRLSANSTTRERITGGLRTIPEDRHADAMIDEWPLDENAALGLQRLPPFAAGGQVNLAERLRSAQEIADRFGTKHGGLQRPMRNLSGGNQQRFVAARALYLHPKLILAFQPVRGIDLAGTRMLYDAIRDECARGAAALVVSFDLDELLDHCDRILVMNRGELFEPKAGQERDRNAIGCLMVGAA